MNKGIFSGLDKLGFKDIENINLYEDDKKDSISNALNEDEKYNVQDLLYDKKVVCPVCGNKFTVKAIKTSSYRMKSKDTDFFIRYEIINPYFYDVWLCNNCGYASMKSDFNKIRNYQLDFVKENISAKWKSREYNVPYDIKTAIERYKLSLLNYYYIKSKSSSKAMNCLKLAWMCRLMDNSNDEQNYIFQALKGFNDAYFNEEFPIYGMNRYTNMYLIGELNRRIGNFDDAMLWFSKVITTPNINKRLKELARDQKDLIKSSKVVTNPDTENIQEHKKTGIFKLFKK